MLKNHADIFMIYYLYLWQLVDGLNDIDGMTCTTSEGAMYAFPRITLPQKALDEAYMLEQTPDSLYALSLLEETGICVVPASGFGQKGQCPCIHTNCA